MSNILLTRHMLPLTCWKVTQYRCPLKPKRRKEINSTCCGGQRPPLLPWCHLSKSGFMPFLSPPWMRVSRALRGLMPTFADRIGPFWGEWFILWNIDNLCLNYTLGFAESDTSFLHHFRIDPFFFLNFSCDFFSHTPQHHQDFHCWGCVCVWGGDIGAYTHKHGLKHTAYTLTCSMQKVYQSLVCFYKLTED